MIMLDSFNLEEFDEKDLDHKYILASLFNDSDTFKYMGNILDFKDNVLSAEDDISNFYIVYQGEKPIGFVSLYYLSEKYEICYAIIPEERKNGVATSLLGEFTNYVFSSYPIEDLYLYINKENEGSIKVAIKNNYIQNNLIEYKKSNRSS